MMPSICIEMIYPELHFEDRIRAIAQHGFQHIEFWSWKDKDPESFSRVLRETGVRVSNFSGQRKGDLIREDQHPLVEEDLRDALRYQRYYESPTLMVLAQELGEGGRVVRPVEREAGEKEIKTLVKGIKRLLKVIEKEGPKSTTLVFEPLNTRLDHPGYAVHSLETAERIYGEVDHPNFGILLDLYHQGMSGDDLYRVIRRYAPIVKYVHAADVPDRTEPTGDGGASEVGTVGSGIRLSPVTGVSPKGEKRSPEESSGKIDWVKVLRTLAEVGYRGFVGFEFKPKGSSDEALQRIADLWRRAV